MKVLASLLLAVLIAGCANDGGGVSEECGRLGDEMTEALQVLEREGSTDEDMQRFLEADSRFDAAGCNEEVDP